MKPNKNELESTTNALTESGTCMFVVKLHEARVHHFFFLKNLNSICNDNVSIVSSQNTSVCDTAKRPAVGIRR